MIKSYKDIEQILKKTYQIDKTPNNQPTLTHTAKHIPITLKNSHLK